MNYGNLAGGMLCSVDLLHYFGGMIDFIKEVMLPNPNPNHNPNLNPKLFSKEEDIWGISAYHTNGHLNGVNMNQGGAIDRTEYFSGVAWGSTRRTRAMLC